MASVYEYVLLFKVYIFILGPAIGLDSIIIPGFVSYEECIQTASKVKALYSNNAFWNTDYICLRRISK